RKPWRQKGTGRARQGSIRAAQWYHGGIVFGPHNRSYDKKMNRKERRLALKSALAYKSLDSKLVVVDNFNLETIKTSEAKSILKQLTSDKNILIVVEELNDNLILATRNLKNVVLLQTSEINTYDVIAADTMIITSDAVKTLEEVLG
ncbi:MAG: 50S ribosomal protein L4, partial [Tenericutes bacterium]|nr:50S ribosomal protein L4 [Mycoplasmatota bacterium]